MIMALGDCIRGKVLDMNQLSETTRCIRHCALECFTVTIYSSVIKFYTLYNYKQVITCFLTKLRIHSPVFSKLAMPKQLRQ